MYIAKSQTLIKITGLVDSTVHLQYNNVTLVFSSAAEERRLHYGYGHQRIPEVSMDDPGRNPRHLHPHQTGSPLQNRPA